MAETAKMAVEELSSVEDEENPLDLSFWDSESQQDAPCGEIRGLRALLRVAEREIKELTAKIGILKNQISAQADYAFETHRDWEEREKQLLDTVEFWKGDARYWKVLAQSTKEQLNKALKPLAEISLTGKGADHGKDS
jgi:hypothetical protein